MTGVEVRRSNSCSVLTDRDFDELVEIAKLDVNAGSWLIPFTESLGGLTSKFVPEKVKSAIMSVLEPILKAGNDAVALTHADYDGSWASWFAQIFRGPLFINWW